MKCLAAAFGLALFTGCLTTETKAEETCGSICDELVYQCSIEAYPDHESCMQGCLFEYEEDGVRDNKVECITTAECDTFVLIDCENT